MSLTERETAGTKAAPDAGVDSYRVVDRMDRTGRLTVESTDGTTYTIVGTGDERISRRLRDCAPGATVRLELSRAPSETGYVAARIKPGSLPRL